MATTPAELIIEYIRTKVLRDSDAEVEYLNRSTDPDLRPVVLLRFIDHENVCLFESYDFNNPGWWTTPRRPGTVKATCWVPGNFFAEGSVSVTACVITVNPTVWHAVEIDAVAFDIVDRSEGDGVRGEITGDLLGVVRPMLDWTIEMGD
jgi:hypothetical protein